MLYINQRVSHTSKGRHSSHTRTGTVIDLDTRAARARVQWDGNTPRTWMRFAALQAEPFTVHATYTVSNAGGYEIELSKDGETARYRDAFDNPKPAISDWLPIVDVSDDGDGLMIIDPEGLYIPLNSCMRV